MASVVPGSALGTRIDPALRSLFGHRRLTGRTPPWYLPSDRFERDGLLPAVIRFSSPPDAVKLAALGRAGVEWEFAGRPLASGAYSAKIDEAGLALLEADPEVTRVMCDLPVNAPRPLDLSAKETGIAYVRRAMRAKDGTLLDGKGLKIADIDSGVFVYHPAFFRADAGVHAWVDVDGDGKLTPGVDGVDIDASGSIEPTETLKELRVELASHPGKLDPALDYLYLDQNGNGKRDYGAGFAEDTPALGEPIFVIDDVDADGVLAPSEKLLRLGTSKISAVRASKAYTRGVEGKGINAYGQALLADTQQLDWAGHGTGVAGILVGGVPDRSLYLGLAPGAELLAVGYGSRSDPSGTTASVQWSIDHGADVILTEYAPYTGYPLDGSSEEEQLLDAAVDKGIVVVNPAGNLAIGYKHQSASIPAGPSEIGMHTDAYFAKGPLVMVTMLYRGDPRTLAMSFKLPDGSTIALPTAGTSGPVEDGKGRLYDVVRRNSAAGTHEMHLQVYAWDGSKVGSLPTGKYALAIDADAAFDAEIFVSDAYNSWARGFVLEKNTAGRTVCHPATNDKGITVAAYPLPAMDSFGGGPQGPPASSSSIGPRIDGASSGIDLAAPDNPFSAGVPKSTALSLVPFEQFGGTSGAGPHVAAAAVLLKQAQPTLTGEALQNRLLESARRDSFVTTDGNRWGKGKLDLAAALGITRKDGTPPTVTLVTPDKPQATKPIELRLDAKDDAPGLRVRWDLDYDGTFDTPWEPIGSKTIQVDAPTMRWVRVDVLDSDGYVRGATAKLVIGPVEVEPPPSNPVVEPEKPSSSSGCGCSTPASDPSASGLGVAGVLALAMMRKRSRRRR